MGQGKSRKLGDQMTAGAAAEFARIIIFAAEMEVRTLQKRFHFSVNVNDRSASAGRIAETQLAAHAGLLTGECPCCGSSKDDSVNTYSDLT
jgi:hypothetical protein